MKKYLIVVDMQNDFIDGSLGTKEAQAIIPNAVKKIREFDGEVIATMDTHFEDYMNTQEGKFLPVKHCIIHTDGWEINKDIDEALKEKDSMLAVQKNAFGSVKLPKIIKKDAGKEPFEIELIGLCTDICVISNALILKASFPEIPISVDASCCAGVTPALHDAALATMRSCQIVVN
jgi:nicotinamidase-related amidase